MPVCISEKTWKDPFRLTKSLQTSKPKALKLDLGRHSLLKEKIKAEKYRKAENNNIISSYQPELTNVPFCHFCFIELFWVCFVFSSFSRKEIQSTWSPLCVLPQSHPPSLHSPFVRPCLLLYAVLISVPIVKSIHVDAKSSYWFIMTALPILWTHLNLPTVFW